MLRAPLRTLILTATATLLAGCPGRFTRPDDFDDDPTRLLAAVAARGAKVESLTAQLRLEVWRKDERVKLRQLVAVRRPDHLRVDSLSPFDQPLSTLVSDGERLSIYALDEHRFFTGPATPNNMARLMPIRLEPHELNALLRGVVPVMPHTAAQVGWDADEGWYRLDLEGPRGRQRIHFEPAGLRVVQTTVWQGDAVRWKAQLGRFDGAGADALPQRLRFEAPKEDLRIDVEVVDHRLNPDLPDAAFELSPPRGIEVERL